jgi:hypothetical protein
MYIMARHPAMVMSLRDLRADLITVSPDIYAEKAQSLPIGIKEKQDMQIQYDQSNAAACSFTLLERLSQRLGDWGSGSESWLGRRAKRAQQEAVLIMFWRWVKG